MEKAGLKGFIEDAAIVPVPNSDMVQVKSIDIFTPIIDEPEITGEIAACNVTNDIFAMNVPEVSGMLIFLAINKDTPMLIAEGILKGIRTFMEQKINSKVVGGHTIYNEWPLIGGEASGFVDKNNLIKKYGVKLGDKILLTKPIGLQAIMAAYRLQKDSPDLLEEFSSNELNNSIKLAIDLMTTSNQGVVKTIYTYDNFSFIHAMTDVTGFGLAGSLKEMLQNSGLSAIIETIPSINLSKNLSEELGYAFDGCLCSETAGGMLLAIDPSKVEDFSNALSSNGISNWTVGTIDSKEAELVRISDKVKQIEITKI
ncbi:MAG: selenide, water dikinase SelD [Promethearchaeota archaeon]|nr:MAG: selenide, water dikinase SelD [Candidatus Lokiarchaeota archaeon]